MADGIQSAQNQVLRGRDAIEQFPLHASVVNVTPSVSCLISALTALPLISARIPNSAQIATTIITRSHVRGTVTGVRACRVYFMLHATAKSDVLRRGGVIAQSLF